MRRPLDLRGAPGADARCLLLLTLLLLCVYLLTMSGRVISGDGETMYLTTRALVTEGSLAIVPRPESAEGRDGRWYSKYGLGQTAVQLPFFVAGHAIGKALGAPDDRAARFAVGMANSVVSAALAGLFWLTLRALGSGRGAATAATLVFGLATLAWPYARADFAEPLQAFSVLLAFYALIRWRRRPGPGWATLAGLAAGLALLTKAASAVLLLPLGAYFLYALWQWRHAGLRALLRDALAAGIPFALCALAQAGLNLARFGSVTEFGYGDEPRTGFVTPLATGISYLLLSPGKGLFLFAPPVLLGLAGLLLLGRRYPLEAGTAFLLFLAQLLYFGRWWAWHGDWSWGPRYLVVTVPLLMLGWGAVLSAWAGLPALLKALAVALAGAGLVVSLLGVVVDYGAYYSVAGAQIGGGVDVRDARHTPEFSPLLGHAWLARASLYELGRDLRASTPEPSEDEARPGNPYAWEYPWRFSHPQRRPEDPSRAFGFDLWFLALRERPPLAEFWSGLVAAWLALALVPLSGRLWSAARPGAPKRVERAGGPRPSRGRAATDSGRGAEQRS
ncbi:MAG TPA: phospholipid carrier-dependent glycosyltransferase, partial [Chloroflexota bacterium]|nr:phospholipid carrier-dependent glycosyltransferase [Chloroflexota bacterium]